MDKSLSKIVEGGVEEVEEFISNSSMRAGAEEPNWLALAILCSDFARKIIDKEPIDAKRWLLCSVRIYEILSELSRQDDFGSFNVSAMRERIYSINILGKEEGDYLLDEKIVIDWFRKAVDQFSLDDLKKNTFEWEKCSFEEVRRLRQLKNVLNAMQTIRCFSSDMVTLSVWFEIKEKLP